jgi:hypothetical protein
MFAADNGAEVWVWDAKMRTPLDRAAAHPDICRLLTDKAGPAPEPPQIETRSDVPPVEGESESGHAGGDSDGEWNIW